MYISMYLVSENKVHIIIIIMIIFIIMIIIPLTFLIPGM